MNFSNFDLFSKELIDYHVFNVKTLGFSVIDNFFNDAICSDLKLRLEKAIEQYSPVNNSNRSVLDKYHMHDLLVNDLIFAQTLEDPRLQQLISPLLGEYWIMYAYTSSTLPPKGENYGSRIHVDCPRFIPNYITNVGVIWALDDFTEANGATHVLPGSHNTELVPSDSFFKLQSKILTCKKGSLIVFNARMWHAAGKNNTSNFRHALTLNACRPYMKQRMDWVRFLPSNITDRLNQQAKRIIGFDTRIPTNLDEFFVSKEELLYKPGQE